MSHSEQVAVIGGGYVGSVTAAVLAHFGHQVALAESEPGRYALLLSGTSPVVEKGLGELLRAGLTSGKLRIFSSAVAAVLEADLVFLCLPTPQSEDGSADLSAVHLVGSEIRSALRKGAIVISKSTVPAGSAALLANTIDRPDVTIVSNPEFLREGSAVADSLDPERIVVGADDHTAARRVAELFSATNAPLIVTSTVTAEMIKYASNAFLATKLSFVNAIATLCEAVGADARDLLVALGYDKRIGFDFLSPGPGWGGSCLPKDTAALLSTAAEYGYEFSMLRAVLEENDEHLARVVDKVRRAVGGQLEGTRVALWGLTFKSNTDDRRSSPATRVARELLRQGARLTAYDPTVAITDTSEDLIGISLSGSAYDACSNSRAVVILTEWDEFRASDFHKVAELMERPAIVDARNLLDPAALRAIGFDYVGIGR